MPVLTLSTAASSWGGKGNRISLVFFNESATINVFYMVDRAEGRTLSSTDNDGLIPPLSGVNFNYFEDGPDVQRGFQLVAASGTPVVGILEMFGTLTVPTWTPVGRAW